LRRVLGEPFTLAVGQRKEQWEEWRADVQQRQDILARLAARYHLVGCQMVFDVACRRAPAEYWIWDGVHPMYWGRQLMADEWVGVVQEFCPNKVVQFRIGSS
jgi:hypothetical protein